MRRPARSTIVIGALGVALGLGVGALADAPGSGGPAASTVGGSLPLQGNAFPSGDGGSADAPAYGTGPQWNVLNWGPGQIAVAPGAYGQNIVDPETGRTVKKIFVSTQANPDVATAPSDLNMSISNDSGRTFTDTRFHYPVTGWNLTRLADGSLLSIDFIPVAENAAHTRVTLRIWRSDDAGATWHKSNGVFRTPTGKTFGATPMGLRVHRHVMQLPDGTLIVPFYGQYTQDSSSLQSKVMQSSDGGRTWTERSTIQVPSTYSGSNEIGWSYVADGRLMAVVRTNTSPVNDLVVAYSSDDAKTWTPGVPMKGPDGATVQGIDPQPLLQPNGILLLATGRPDDRVLISYDGNGTRWDVQRTLFANYPSDDLNGRYDGTGGNASMVNVGPSRSVFFYDQCSTNTCGAYNDQYGVSEQYVSAVTPGTGRIDVDTLLHQHLATITGTFAPRDAAFPEQRAEGAVDGSADPGADAVLQRRHATSAPAMTIELDRAYPIDRIGLMLGHGEAQSAQVRLSADGVHWSDPVVTATGVHDRAMRYSDVPTQSARFVRVTGARDAATTVSELELYAAGVDTFENEAAFSVPRGWTDAEHTWTTDVPANPGYSEFGGYRSATALRLWDKWTDSNAHVTRPFAATDHVHATMQWGTADERASFTVGVDGTTDGTSGRAWDFRIAAGATATTPQSVQAYDGHTWVTLGHLNAMVPAKTYVPLAIDADADQATLTVNGQAFATTTRATPHEDGSRLTALAFTTGDASEYGGIYFLDDVAVQPAA